MVTEDKEEDVHTQPSDIHGSQHSEQSHLSARLESEHGLLPWGWEGPLFKMPVVFLVTMLFFVIDFWQLISHLLCFRAEVGGFRWKHTGDLTVSYRFSLDYNCQLHFTTDAFHITPSAHLPFPQMLPFQVSHKVGFVH